MWLEGEENYEDWKDNMTLFLGSRGLARFIKKESVTPEPTRTKRQPKDGMCYVNKRVNAPESGSRAEGGHRSS